jgi:hypothetical protein
MIFQNGKQSYGSMRSVYADQRKRAKRRGLAYTLSFEQWLALICLNCYLCNGRPANSFKVASKKSYKQYPNVIYQGLDRINSSKGYTLNNVAPCCKHCNYMKREFSKTGLKKHIMKIVKFQGW